jgi:hypothetical protein
VDVASRAPRGPEPAAAVVGESLLITACYLYYRDVSPVFYSAAMAIMAAFVAYARFAMKPL